MANGAGEAIDPKTALSSKYAGEAQSVAKLLETNTQEAANRLQLDSHMKPHEFHAFMKEVKTAYEKDKQGHPDLPNVSFTDDKTGIQVAVGKPGEKDVQTVFARKAEELKEQADKQGDKPIPYTGVLLGLSKDDTKRILDIQAQEKKDNNGKSHKFGDIAVSLGLKTPEEVNAALDKQDHMRAKQAADDLSKAMPLAPGEGYVPMVHRTHPELADPRALGHMIKRNNHNRINLAVGSELPVLNHKQHDKTEAALYAGIHKGTGQVIAKPGQDLKEIPLS